MRKSGSGCDIVDFYHIELTYDLNSNITTIRDHVHDQFSAGFEMDNLDRLIEAEHGTWDTQSGGIDTTAFIQDWQLSHTGNWLQAAFNRNGDQDYADPGEYEHTSTDTGYTDANELTTWGAAEPAYDAVGNKIDDGEHYEYIYDVFGRLRKVLNRDTEALVAEYTYNGLNHRVGWHYDVTDDQGGGPDGSVDGDDPWYHFVYDERWRIVAAYRADTTTGDLDDDPKEQFIYHAAGLDGYGSGSYIDTVILRDRDANATGGWAGEADGTLEERRYYAQNWRHDVVAIVTAAGVMAEQVRYSAYGVPFGLPQGDVDGDGTVDGADASLVLGAWGENAGDPGYDVRIDINLDGTIDGADHAIALGNNAATLGWDALSEDPDDGLGNRIGYAGYQHDPALAASWTLYHVRHRVYNADLGRWTRRDPLGYVDGMSLYAYVRSGPVDQFDSDGQITVQALENINPPTPRQLNCQDDLLRKCSSIIKRAYDRYKQDCAGQTGKLKSLSIVCRNNRPAGGGGRTLPVRRGEYCCDANVIYINEQSGSLCYTLAHELLHAADQCRNRQCKSTFQDNGDPCGQAVFDRDSCAHLLCTEARAAGYVSCCNSNEENRKDMHGQDLGWQHCVNSNRRHYIDSILDSKRIFGAAICPLTREQALRIWNDCLPNEKDGCCNNDDSIPALPLPIPGIPNNPNP